MIFRLTSTLAAAVMLLCGCAEDVMKSYTGQDISHVIVKQGPPMNTLKLPDGRTAFQWREDKSMMMPTYTNVYGYGNSATAITSGGGIVNSSCIYTLYALPNAQKSFTVTGYEPPSLDCQ